MAKQDTNNFTKKVVDLLTILGFVVWRNNNAGVYDVRRKSFRAGSVGRKGVPDIIGYQKKTGRGIYVEIKTGSDKLSPEQKHFLIEALQNNCIAFECRSMSDLSTRLQMYDPEISGKQVEDFKL